MATKNPDKSTGTRLDSELPSSILEKSIGFLSSNDQSSFNLNTFLKQRLPATDHSKIKDQLAKNFTLSARRTKPEKRVCKRKTELSLKEKRDLGLYNITRTGLKYNDFLFLHKLWVEYMMESLDFTTFQARGQADVSHKHWESLSLQLTKADYHGAYVRVSRSRCPSHVGLEGIVVMDTKYTFKVLGKDNIARTVPKEPSVFTITLDKYQLTVYGKHFCIRPSERSTKKMKTYLLPDL